MRKALLLLAILLMVLPSIGFSFPVVYENGHSSHNGSGQCIPCGTSWRTFDDFSLPSDTTVGGAEFGLQWPYSQSNTSYTVNLFSGLGFDPLTSPPIYTGIFTIGDNAILGDQVGRVRHLKITFAPTLLFAGDYYIEIHGDQGNAAWSFDNGGHSIQTKNGQAFERNREGDFRIFGAEDDNGHPGDNNGDHTPTNIPDPVPEPSTAILLLTGLSAMGLVLRKKKQNS